jgi:hypothetical protein
LSAVFEEESIKKKAAAREARGRTVFCRSLRQNAFAG